MGIGEVFFALLVIGIAVSWIFAAIRAYQSGRSKGVTMYLLHLVGAVATVFGLWLIIVYPHLHCHGFLCGLEYVILWLILSMIVLLVWPLVVLAIFKKKWPEIGKVEKKNEEILDDLE